MTTQECECRDQRLIERIRSVINVHQQLQSHAAGVEVGIDDSTVVLTGQLPSDHLRAALEPAVRRAGVLAKIDNRVSVG